MRVTKELKAVVDNAFVTQMQTLATESEEVIRAAAKEALEENLARAKEILADPEFKEAYERVRSISEDAPKSIIHFPFAAYKKSLLDSYNKEEDSISRLKVQLDVEGARYWEKTPTNLDKPVTVAIVKGYHDAGNSTKKERNVLQGKVDALILKRNKLLAEVSLGKDFNDVLTILAKHGIEM